MKLAPVLMASGLLAALLALGGCINWQAGFDAAARNSCMHNPDEGQRRACLNAADENARERRAEQHKH